MLVTCQAGYPFTHSIIKFYIFQLSISAVVVAAGGGGGGCGPCRNVPRSVCGPHLPASG
jgi:hypothetical protein